MPQSIETFLLYNGSDVSLPARIVYTSIGSTSQDEAEGERQFTPTTSRAELLDGRRLNWIDEDTFQVVGTGEILKRKL